MSNGRTVRLFLVDGTPGGLVTAEIMNWTGHVIAAPRSSLGDLLKRPEVKSTGVYILIGDNPDQFGDTIAYFGEGDDVGARLRLHAQPEDKGGKDFWNRALVLTSKDANLTKAHVRYLESRFISLATTARRTKLANVTAPPLTALPEADVSDMESFIAQAQNVLPILGVNFLRSMAAITEGTAQRPGQASTAISPTFQMHVRKHNITATAREVDGDFTVLTASTALATWVGSKSGYKALHAKLVADGSIETAGSDIATFTRDIVFSSVSAAGAVVTGRECNGRTAWKMQDTGETYGDWQNRGVDDSIAEVTDE